MTDSQREIIARLMTKMRLEKAGCVAPMCASCEEKPVARVCSHYEECIDGYCADCGSDQDVDPIVYDPDGRFFCDYHRPFRWSVNDAFGKFGNDDGNRYNNYTSLITVLIENLGYEVKHDSWGCHNGDVIIKIEKGGDVVYPPNDFKIGGYDSRDVMEVLPQDIQDAIVDDGYDLYEYHEFND